MAAITTAHDVNDVVYHVSEDEGVRKGVVKSTAIAINPLATTIEYAIQFTDAALGSATALESEVYDDIDLALAAYKLLVE